MKLNRILILAVTVILAVPLGPTYAKDADLVIYTYDSFVSEWGLGPKIIPKFEALYNAKVQLVSVGDAGQVLNRAILEKSRPRADIIVGVDNNLLARAIDAGILLPYRPQGLSAVPADFIFDRSHRIIPFDHGYFAIVYDSKKIDSPPTSLEDLAHPRFKKKLILEDPRTSSPGLGFLLWTVAVYGDRYTDYWKRLMPNVLTITEGWDSAYGLFTSGEAPMVMSYTTSPAYHVEYEDTTRYRAAIFEEGNYLQIEGMGILKKAAHTELARKFMDFILTEEFQSEIPLTNWMYPVNPSVMTPDSFRYAPKPKKGLSVDPFEIQENQERWVDEWLSVVTR